ncbi:MAG: hypothetical protein H6817_01525 [Phycisphaerales bacterium]|nr:hypothetical protein [Phycisphaerales bacterium]
MHAEADGTLYVARHYRIYRSQDDGCSWSPVASMPYSPKRRIGSLTRLTSRLLRVEVRALLRLDDGTLVASNREGVYYATSGAAQMQRSQVDDGDTPSWPPMTMSLGPNNRILWGEYGANREKRSARIFVSDDGGRRFAVAYAFKPGEIRHIHNLYFDAGLNKYWVLAGDHEHEPGIGLLSADLRDFDWVVKGEQSHRAVGMFDFGDRIVYGTDTEMEPNAVISLDKATGKLRRVVETDGSCIYACRFGGIYAITTSIEPSKVNHCRSAKLLLSRDGESWHEVFAAPKDCWNENYFQFGSLILPRGASERETIIFSGQAVRSVDDRVRVCKWTLTE